MEGKMKRWELYILRCGDDTLYTGITDDFPRRFAAHSAGKGAKYTRGRGPLTVCYREACPEKGAALRREIEVKKLTRAEKLALCESWHPEQE
ncbi:MAG: GIY-YIG nuclease family protein [Faecousia sp.]